MMKAKLKMKTLTTISKPVLASALLLGAAFSSAVSFAAEVNVYSGRKEALIKPALKEFTEKTGIKVNLVTGKADALMQRLLAEGEATPADVLITVDVGRLSRAKSANLFQAVNSATLQQAIPTNLRDVDQQWFGLSLRARPIFYSKERFDPKNLSSYEALTDAALKGKVCIRSSGNIYNQSLVASLISANGAEAMQTWLPKFVANFARKPTGGDTDQLRAVAAGVCDVAIANTYYYGRLLNSQKAEDQAVAAKVGLFWPNQDARGVHVNVSGAGVIKSAKNTENAIKLIEFLASAETQQWYAEINNEFPVVAGVAQSDTLKSWGEFKSDQVVLSQLGELNAEAVKLMDQAAWR